MRDRKGRPINHYLAQAIIRIFVLVIIAVHLIVATQFGAVDRDFAKTVVIVLVLASPVSVALVIWELVNPKPAYAISFARFTGLALNCFGTAWLMIAGGKPMLPAFALMLWMVVGNGIRFGLKAIAAATAIALLILLAAAEANDYWRDDPFVMVTLILTTLAVPVYIRVLLGRLQEANRALSRASLTKSLFLAQASHDLRQPIHAISLFTACLREADLKRPELEMVDNIDRSLASVSRLFKSLLDISTLDSGKVVASHEAVSIRDVLEDVERQNADAAAQSGTLLSVVSCGCTVSTDRALLTTMLQNVVNNAIKYGPGSRVLIGCRRSGDELSIEVHDTGPGIEYEHQARVFDEFYRVRRRGERDIEGVGLGLSIVRRVADLLGLTVTLRSQVDRGTVVRIAGLLVIDEAPAVSDGPRIRVGALPVMAGLRVLLVEDDQPVRVATTSLLRSWGCIVQAEANLPACVEACDLLITDYDLGEGATGTECIAMVRAMLGRDLPAVVMTGHDASRVREDVGDSTVPVLSKPLQPAELRSVLLSAAARANAEASRIEEAFAYALGDGGRA